MGLKLDFVNDVAAHYGEITETDLFYRTDSVRNILSNKVTAIFRMSAKDIVDIHRICLNEKFEWREVFEEVREKELGVLVRYPLVSDEHVASVVTTGGQHTVERVVNQFG